MGGSMTDGGSFDGKIGRTVVDTAQLALLLEVSGTPKPGNVDRHRDLADLHFEHFLAGAIGARPGLAMAARGEPIGSSFERAVAGMARQRGGNTQFGCLLLLVPLVRAAATDSLTPNGVREVVEATTVADVVEFYCAFEHVAVAVADPPADADALDVRRGSDAVSTLRERELTLYDVMELSATHEVEIADGNARLWTNGFDRAFDAADAILEGEGQVLDRTARAFLDCLAAEPDSLIATTHGAAVAREVSQRAERVAADCEATGELAAAEALAEEFVAAGYNPGTTADLLAAALFIALHRGVEL